MHRLVLDHNEHLTPEFGEPGWYNLRSQPNKSRRGAFIKLPKVAACGEQYPVDTGGQHAPLESNLIVGLDYLGEHCRLLGYENPGNGGPPVLCSPPRREAGRRSALTIAISDSTWWRVPNTSGVVDYVMCHKCATFFKGGTMADYHNGRTHHSTLLRDVAMSAGLCPSWMPLRVVPQTSRNWHTSPIQKGSSTVQENNNELVFGRAGCHVFETSVALWDSLYVAEHPGHHVWEGDDGLGLHHDKTTGPFIGERLAAAFRTLDVEYGGCVILLQVGWNIQQQEQERENPVLQELLEARWGADLEKIIRRHAPQYVELMHVARANSFQFEGLRLESEASKESKHRHKDVPKYNNPVYGKTADLGRLFPD